MSSAFSSIGNIFSTGLGAVSNFLTSRKQNKYLDNQIAYQKLLMQYAKDPALMNSRVASFEKPLSQGLTAGVGNAVQAQLAQRGLGASPSIATEVLAQALAPYQQNEQQMAINEAFSSLGLPSQAPQPNFPQPLDLSTMIQGLLTPKETVPVDTSGGSVLNMPEPNEPVSIPNLPPSGDPSSIFDIILGLAGAS